MASHILSIRIIAFSVNLNHLTKISAPHRFVLNVLTVNVTLILACHMVVLVE